MNKTVTSKTVTYFQNLVDSLTVLEAISILYTLLNVDLRVWYILNRAKVETGLKGGDFYDAKGIYWRPVVFDKVPVNFQCKIKRIKLKVGFYGGSLRYYKYYTGYLRNFVCDRLLRNCLTEGKTVTSRCIWHTLTRLRAEAD